MTIVSGWKLGNLVRLFDELYLGNITSLKQPILLYSYENGISNHSLIVLTIGLQVLRENNVKEELKARALALKILGKIFQVQISLNQLRKPRLNFHQYESNEQEESGEGRQSLDVYAVSSVIYQLSFPYIFLTGEMFHLFR